MIKVRYSTVFQRLSQCIYNCDNRSPGRTYTLIFGNHLSSQIVEKMQLKYISLIICFGFVTSFQSLLYVNKNARRMTTMTFNANSDSIQLPTKKHIVATLAAFSVLFSSVSPSWAGNLEDANNKLTQYGLPPILFVPPGFAPVVSEYGRGNIKEKMTNPLLVQFSRPQLWVVGTTSVNNNGEAGTISANDYIKGDSAFFFTQPLGDDSSLTGTKAQIEKFLLKSLSQKGDPVESFKILSIKPTTDSLSGKTYYTVDLSYTLNTEAGFLVDRRGVASITSVGPDIQGLVSVTTTKRWKGLETELRDVSNSFRVYPLNSGVFTTVDYTKMTSAPVPINSAGTPSTAATTTSQ